ncbi:MAG: oligopeptide/dipeptide ABC transporter ATP-binding protein [Bradymonadia bacterium]|jgi:oligopeptide/dipeptide ABC transporter ATP-binding protein
MTQQATEPVLEVTGLDKSFFSGGWSRQGTQVLHGVGLVIGRGEVVALVGESGSGKSTVARIVSRLETADAGSVKISGVNFLKKEPKRASREFRGRVQMIFQDPFGSLNPVHTVAHHIERPLLLHKRVAKGGTRQAIVTLLEEVGLTPGESYADRYPHELSGGQRQRVAIARALAVEPELILADEPTSMLDVATRLGVLKLLRRLTQEREISILMITHDLASARQLADRVMVMYAGRIVETGPTDDLLTNPSHPYTQTLIASLPRGDGSFRAPVELHASAEPASIGCPFAPRCPDASEQCRGTAPSSHNISAHHSVNCHLFLSTSNESIS